MRCGGNGGGVKILLDMLLELPGLLRIFAPGGPMRNLDPKPRSLLGMEVLAAILFLAVLVVSAGAILLRTLLQAAP